MSRWMDRRGDQPRRMSHVFRRESSPASPFNTNRNAPLAEQARRARERLQELGLGYSCLALYLSSRIDLLPAEFCFELGLTPDTSPPLTPSEIARIFEEEISPVSKGTLIDFNSTPIYSTLLTHVYAAK